MIFEENKSAVVTFSSSQIRAKNAALSKLKNRSQLGMVSLVGAGPGDPDLLTLKALRVIEQADVIVYDNLVSHEIRALFPHATESIYVGKIKGAHSYNQSKINQLLIDKSRQGLTVCRLKGGDPFVFGRGGEEMLLLKEQGIDVQIVPGITAAAGCSSYAGIPLTHRGLAQGCTFITGHAEKELAIKWHALAELDHTLVFYMGLSKAALIEKELLQAGLAKNTPVALIENGCCPEQRVITGSLSELASLVVLHQIKSPSLIMVGKVVALVQQRSVDSAIDQLSQLTA
ncbi:MAG: uroporphyrin-III C-methyltransferase [Psychromonas sp.]|jgi:uroporphyrin-III C-methyltransferase|uniref:uroporphyrinogen-III C-methyltransferase n=1 Tax=Psychromonas sp. TaxID=1884585 RepID=UPI0039E416BC